MILQGDKLTIRELKSTYNELLNVFEKNQSLEIDFKNIDEIDMGGIQLLISLKKTCNEQNKELKLLNIKDELLFAFEISSTDSILEI